jgi:hypothetical protein
VVVTAGNFAFTNPSTTPGAGAANQPVTFTPTDTANYSTVVENVSVAVAQKPLTITGVTAADKIYDATISASLSVGSLVGVESGDEVTITVGTGTFSDANIGAGKEVTAAGYAIGGANADNYSLSAQPSGMTADITARDLTITAQDKRKIVGEDDPVFTVLYSGFAIGEDEELVSGLVVNRAAGETVGLYAITPSGGTAINYAILFVNGILTIAEDPNIAPTLTEATTQTMLENTTITLTTAMTNGADADKDTLTLIVLDGDNYTVSGTSITPTANYSGTLIVPVKVSDGKDTTDAVEMEVVVEKVIIIAELHSTDISLLTGKSITILPDRFTITSNTVDSMFVVIDPGSNYTVNSNTIIPASTFTGVLTIPVHISDGTTSSETRYLNVTVKSLSQNKAPVIVSADGITIEKNDTCLLTTNKLVVTDEDDPVASLQLLLEDGDGYTISGKTIIPDKNLVGIITIPLRITDGLDTSAVFNAKVSVFEKVVDFHKGQVEMKGLHTVVVAAGPNPAPVGARSIKISSSAQEYDRMEVKIYDSVAKLVGSGNGVVTAAGGLYEWPISGRNLGGSYLAIVKLSRKGVPVDVKRIMIGVRR